MLYVLTVQYIILRFHLYMRCLLSLSYYRIGYTERAIEVRTNTRRLCYRRTRHSLCTGMVIQLQICSFLNNVHVIKAL